MGGPRPLVRMYVFFSLYYLLLIALNRTKANTIIVDRWRGESSTGGTFTFNLLEDENIGRRNPRLPFDWRPPVVEQLASE